MPEDINIASYLVGTMERSRHGLQTSDDNGAVAIGKDKN